MTTKNLPEWLTISGDILGRVAVCIAISYIGYKFVGSVGVVLTVPAWAVMSAKPIMMFFTWYFKTMAEMPLRKYNGNYYEFANTQIRIFVIDKRLWCVDRDVMKVIEGKINPMLESLYDATEYHRILGTVFTGFSETGMEKLLSKSKHVEALRMLYWFKREILKPHHRKLELARGVVDEKVSSIEDVDAPLKEAAQDVTREAAQKRPSAKPYRDDARSSP